MAHRLAITLKDSVVQQGKWSKYTLARISHMPKRFEVHVVPSADNPTGIGEPGLPPNRAGDHQRGGAAHRQGAARAAVP